MVKPTAEPLCVVGVISCVAKNVKGTSSLSAGSLRRSKTTNYTLSLGLASTTMPGTSPQAISSHQWTFEAWGA